MLLFDKHHLCENMQYIVHKNMTYNDLVSKQLFYWNDKNPTHHNSHIHTHTYIISRYCYIYIVDLMLNICNGPSHGLYTMEKYIIYWIFQFCIRISWLYTNRQWSYDIYIYLCVRVWEKPHRSKSYFHFFLLAPALHCIALARLQFS